MLYKCFYYFYYYYYYYNLATGSHDRILRIEHSVFPSDFFSKILECSRISCAASCVNPGCITLVNKTATWFTIDVHYHCRKTAPSRTRTILKTDLYITTQTHRRGPRRRHQRGVRPVTNIVLTTRNGERQLATRCRHWSTDKTGRSMSTRLTLTRSTELTC